MMIERILTVMDTRCVHKDDLAVVDRADTDNPVSSGLGLWRHNRNFLTQECVHQGGFTHIGAAYKGDKSGAVLSHKVGSIAC